MLKTSFQPVDVLPATSINNSEIFGSSSKNDGKLAKSDFTKHMHGVEEFSFLTSDNRQDFIQLRQAFTKTSIP